tara:strand:+ start:3768 stop:5630 length:1863 start_codon:yes stop_codon:yes gene_type:complete
MCGILGAISKNNLPSEVEFKNAINSIAHRGPDSKGFEILSNTCIFGHVRLSILDLSNKGSQPMTSSCGRYSITYNGEIYNFKVLQKKFNLNNLKTRTDTEVILELFKKIGVKTFSELNGMFALAIRDNKDHKIYLTRDRLGIKPLYFYKNQNSFLFASEIKAVYELLNKRKEINFKKFSEWLYYGNSLGKETLHKDIYSFEPGNYAVINEKNLSFKIIKYWQIPLPNSNLSKSNVQEIIAETQSLLEQSIKRHLISDVPVGIFLSGGIDSSAITAIASKHYDSLSTYSVGFDFDGGINELQTARKTAKLFNTNHNEINIGGYDIADSIIELVGSHDQPFSDAANIPLYLISKKIRGEIKVVLQGDGGDELFGGYKRYQTLSNIKLMQLLSNVGNVFNNFSLKKSGFYKRKRYFSALLAKRDWKKIALLLTVESEDKKIMDIFGKEYKANFILEDPFKRYQDIFPKENIPLIDKLFMIDAQIILPDIFLEKVDRSTMASGLEVRVPFLDNDLVDYIYSIPAHLKVPNGKQKWLLKKALRGTVPDNVLEGKKMGFSVPYGYWISNQLKELLYDSINSANSNYQNIFNVDVIDELFSSHINVTRDNSFILWKILNMAIWLSKK